MKPSKKKTRTIKTDMSKHGVLVDVYGVGILLVGPSGSGKSECALDLVARGHRLVADDLVLLRRDSVGDLNGSSPEISRYHMEVRGLGILNIQTLYGAAAVRDVKKVDMLLELVPLEDREHVDRLGIVVATKKLLGVLVPHVQVPSWKGRNLTTIIEVAARNQILRWAGKDSAVEFEKRHREEMCDH